MKAKDLISAVAESESVPASKVRKVAKAISLQIIDAIEKGEKVTLPNGLVLTPRVLKAREATGDKPARPERKVGMIKVRPKKQKSE